MRRFVYSKLMILILCLLTTDFEPTLKICKRHSFAYRKLRCYDVNCLKFVFMQISLWTLLLLILCGDIESNPGPTNLDCCSCTKQVTAQDSIRCGFCENFFHFSCAELTDQEASVYITKAKLYICQDCEVLAKRFFRLEKRLEMCEQKLDSLDQKMDNVLSSLEELKTVPKNDVNISSQFQALFELESKKRNAVVFGIPTTAEGDLEFLRDLAENSSVQSSDILYTFKDGPDHDSSGTKIPQFNKVVFSTTKARNTFLSLIKKKKPEGIRARADLTFAQREANRKLRSELDRRLDSGEADLRIDYKNMKIVHASTNYNNAHRSVPKFHPN